VVIVGSRGSLDFTPRLTMLKEATIQGTAIWYATAQEAADALTAVAAGLDNGVIRPVVGDEMPLREAAAAHRKILEPGTRGKLILTTD
jgi:NADPH2:quinone reductase